MKHAKGMTLLEVIVALAVFSIAAVSITKNLGEQMANMPILSSRTLAQWVADNQMVEAWLAPQPLELGTKEGQVLLAGQDWYWRQEVSKTSDNDFRMIRISVSDDQNYKNIAAQVDSYVVKND